VHDVRKAAQDSQQSPGANTTGQYQATQPHRLRMSQDHPGRLPRLHDGAYLGYSAIHWTLTTADRKPLPLCDAFHSDFREQLFHTFSRQHLLCPIYCLMPDHIHLIWMGLHPHTDQRNAMRFHRTHLEPLLHPTKLQHQAYDHVLRIEEVQGDAFQNGCYYIANNPVRAGLVTDPTHWQYTGFVIPGYPWLDLFSASYWPTFFKILTQLRSGHKPQARPT
jgi:putative transposase